MLSRRGILAAGLAATPALAIAQTAPSAPVPPTIDELIGEASVLDAALSPDGKQLAVLRQQKTPEGKRASFIQLLPTNQGDANPALVKLGETEATTIEWANHERLLVWITFRRDRRGKLHGVMYGDTFIPVPMRRVISVGLEGKAPVALFADEKSIMRNTFDAATVVDYMQDDPRLILMQAWEPRRGVYALHTVDVYTGEATPIEYGNSQTDLWLTQRGAPMLRLDSNFRGTEGRLYGRAPGEKDWKLIRKSRLNEQRKLPDFDVVGVTPEAGVFLVSVRTDGADTKQLRLFDIRTMAFGQVVADQPGRDVETAFVDENLKLVATAYMDDVQNYRFADPELAAHFRAVQGFFKGQANVTLFDIDTAHRKLVFTVSGPKEPGAFYVYHRDRQHLEMLGAMRPALTPERLAGVEVLKVKTRDGAEIGAYLTVPITPSAGPRPMVVMPHGGPEVRDSLAFDVFAQALAARGWLVLQPNFRGSGGFGKAFADLGRKQWGDRMQEDIEDAAAQVVASGRADPKRLAIFGLSFGGYSALMGAVRKPELYKAAVSVAGDAALIDTLAFSRKEDGDDSPTYAYWLASIGDPKADEAMLRRASPALRAAEIKAPVLLIHGTEDKAVDPKQSRIMARALKDAGKTYEHIEMKREGHDGWSRDNLKMVLEKVTGFIGQHI